MEISSFDDLLRAARAQARPQRLLFVFATAVLPDAPTPAQRAAFEAGEGGALQPLMCVDKAPDELGSFAQLVEESRQFGADWQIVFAGAMDAAGEAATDQALERLVASVRDGAISALLPLDRNGRVLQLGR
jgi:hypothetical protein